MKNKGVLFGLIFLIVFIGISLVFAEKIEIDVKNSYLPGENVTFKLILYDDNTQKIQGNINYIVYNYYVEPVVEGSSNSGEEVTFKIPEDTIQKPWKIVANYGDIQASQLFNVGELGKAEMTIEGDILIIKNLGNVPYEKSILIYIGDKDQTASVFLDVGQTKRIRLTAPDGVYDIKIVDGDGGKALEFKGITLTGNVIGLERLNSGGFFQQYRIVSLFLISLVLVGTIVFVLKVYKRFSG